jgi:L-threonine kinase
MHGVARAPGTCGELVQGKINGYNFLVTCPVEIYSVVSVKLNKLGKVVLNDNLDKVQSAIEKTLSFLGKPELGAEVEVSSAIPRGKGMASSTADIAAAIAAVAVAMGVDISLGDISEIALAIEPTDGIMFPGIVLFDHIRGKKCRVLGKAPELEVVIVDLGGIVDTLIFNENPELDRLNNLKEKVIKSVLEKLEKALASGDNRLLGEAAVESAFANQKILFKPELEQIYNTCIKMGGFGVNIAHSGTVVGLFFEKGKNLGDKAIKELNSQGFSNLYHTNTINGGIEVLTERSGDMVWKPLDTYMAGTFGKQRKNTG